ncbi:MAG: amidase, partial [Muribaculum sp.]|nr:amidase [Muribaculum sp.]
CSRSGIDFGEITDLRPLSRGRSGRIYRLEIIGTKCSHIVGKELEIRKWLSRSHLYSSAFVPVKSADGFTLYGAGWGHGVGLCQIGAAVMGASGYDYREILLHYFKNAEINKMY